MKNIKERLTYHKELDLVEVAEWIVREALNNNIYKFNANDDLSNKWTESFIMNNQILE